jgi:hypothetical protein
LLSKHVPDAMFELRGYYPLIDGWSARGDIDSTDNLRGFKAYVYMGMRDVIILPSKYYPLKTQLINTTIFALQELYTMLSTSTDIMELM